MTTPNPGLAFYRLNNTVVVMGSLTFSLAAFIPLTPAVAMFIKKYHSGLKEKLANTTPGRLLSHSNIFAYVKKNAGFYGRKTCLELIRRSGFVPFVGFVAAVCVFNMLFPGFLLKNAAISAEDLNGAEVEIDFFDLRLLNAALVSEISELRFSQKEERILQMTQTKRKSRLKSYHF